MDLFKFSFAVITLLMISTAVHSKPKHKKHHKPLPEIRNPRCGELDPCQLPEFCNDGDVVADPADCYRYYECNLGYEWLNRECPFPFLFNNETCECWESPDETCHPECDGVYTTPARTTLPSGTCPEEELPCLEMQKYPDQGSCFTYYLCLNQQFVLQYCPAGSVFETDPDVLDCIYPYEGFDCYNRCEDAEKKLQLTTAEFPTLCGVNPCDRTDYCRVGEETAHPYNCTVYYRCLYGEWQLTPCPAGTFFNFAECGCLSFSDSECFDSDLCAYYTTPEYIPPGPCPDTPEPCQEGVMYADQADCEYYHLCNNSQLIRKQCDTWDFLTTCVAGFPCLFDIYENTCLTPPPESPFRCDERCSSSNALEGNGGKEDAEVLQLTTEYPIFCEVNPCSLPDYCRVNEITADPYNCTRHYRCLYGVWTLFPCPEGTFFNYGDCGCTAIEDDFCFDGSTCPATTTSVTPAPGPCPGVPDPCEEGERYPDRVDCEFYHRCINGTLYKQQCDANDFPGTCYAGLPCLFDVYDRVCVYPPPDSGFNCNERCIPDPAAKQEEEMLVTQIITTKDPNLCLENPCNLPDFCTVGEVTADAYNCTRYYQCIFGEWTLQPCPEGTYFHFGDCQCTSFVDTFCFNGSVCGDITTPEQLEPGPCPGTPDPCVEDELYPDKADCDYYHECVDLMLTRKMCNTSVFATTCVAGLPCVFDIYTHICRTPDEDNPVNCRERCVPDAAAKQEEGMLVTQIITTEDPLLCLENPCNLPDFCTLGEVTADAYNCTRYYQCIFGEWTLQPCPEATYFHFGDCLCSSFDDSFCFDGGVCADITTPEPLEPGPCPGTPDPCVEGELYPDKADCDYYHECVNLTLSRKLCNTSEFATTCVAGLPCVFDIYTHICLTPDEDNPVNCRERCINYTTMGPIDSANNPRDDAETWEEEDSDAYLGFAPHCKEGRRYPDTDDCHYFYECRNGRLGTRQKCDAVESPLTCTADSVCVFDAGTESCVTPSTTDDLNAACGIDG